MRTQIPAALLATALVCSVFAAPVQAQTRAFVSAAGSDSNSCINVNSPCRHFQNAYNAMPAGGEIDVLDPANYGSLTVTHTLSIVGRGWATLSPVAGAAAITINAGASDTISIDGVTLDGGHLSNTNGIVFNSGGSLTVTNSLLHNFAGDSFHGAGILFNATAQGLIDHVVSINNEWGIKIPVTATVVISNSIASANSQTGIVVQGGTQTVSIDNVAANGNVIGIDAEIGATVMLGRSVVTANSGQGIENGTSNTFFSFSDNRIYGNAQNIDGALNYSRTPN